MKRTLLFHAVFYFFISASHAQNVGVGTSSPSQRLHVAGNFKTDGFSVEGNTSYRVYRNLTSYSAGSGATGAFVITTGQPWNSTCMFRVKIEGYFYDATAPFEITVGGYIYNDNNFYNYGYVNNGSKKLNVRLARNNATNTVAILLGDELASYSYPKLTVTSFMQGHASANETYAAGWTISQATSIANFSYIVTVPDASNSGDYIKNQISTTQSANYWISGIGRVSQLQLTNSNTALTQGSGNSLRVTTNSGFTEVGAQNTGWSHFNTNLPRYYFNKGITVDEGLVGSYDEDLSLQTSGATRITASNSTGHVGIGTTAPAERLHVSGGNVRIGGNYALNTEGDHLKVMYGVRADDNSYEWIGFYSNTMRQGIILYDGAWTGANNLTNEFSLTAESGNLLTLNTTSNHVAIMPKGGYTGIGTTSPAEYLHVANNIRSDGIVYWGSGLVRTEGRNDAGLQGNAGARSGFFETSAPSPSANWPSGASSWWHLLDVRHSNNANNYALQLAGSFFDQDLYFRKTNNNPAQPWSKILAGNQGATVYSSTTEITISSNNTGSFAYTPAGSGWTPGTWQTASGFSVTRNITAGSTVHITVTARVEGDNYNSYVPSSAYFRVTRGGAVLATTAVMMTVANYIPSGFWYYISNNLSFNIIDTGVSGSQTYSVEYWLPNEFSQTESVRLAERYLNVIELR